MKLRQIGSNQTELTLPCGAVVLFSYETPVAAQLASGGFVRTEQKWSVTTSRHINKWLQGIDAQEVPQADLYNTITLWSFRMIWDAIKDFCTAYVVILTICGVSFLIETYLLG